MDYKTEGCYNLAAFLLTEIMKPPKNIEETRTRAMFALKSKKYVEAGKYDLIELFCMAAEHPEITEKLVRDRILQINQEYLHKNG